MKLKPIERYALKFLESHGNISLVIAEQQEVQFYFQQIKIDKHSWAKAFLFFILFKSVFTNNYRICKKCLTIFEKKTISLKKFRKNCLSTFYS